MTAISGHTRPRLVWTYVPAPHFPLVYEADGRSLPIIREKLWWFDLEDPKLYEHYRGNLQHLDTLVLGAVQDIVRVDSGAVIVLLSDHGSLLELGGPQETLNILTLARTLGYPRLLGDHPTPVNLLPRLFNTYLGTELPIRPDLSYQVETSDGLDWTLVSSP